jgi:NAD(P)-dependent dehydrogenase (short-subunit alcohol dehydrogenase family)
VPCGCAALRTFLTDHYGAAENEKLQTVAGAWPGVNGLGEPQVLALGSVFFCTGAAVRAMIEGKRRRPIINISSTERVTKNSG